MSSEKHKKIRYIIGTILFLSGLTSLNNEILTSILIMLLGLSLMPFIYENCLNKYKIKNLSTIIPILIFIGYCGLNSLENNSLESDYIKEPMEFTEIGWPNSEIAKLVPIPKSSLGKIEWESSNGFVIYISLEGGGNYSEYVEECYNSGFDVDYRKGDDYFYANNKDGYHLSLNLEDKNVLFIRLDAPKNKIETTTKKATTKETTKRITTNNTTTNTVGSTISCKNFDVTLEKYEIKKKGTAIDSFTKINDPEWIGVTLTIKNTSDSVHTFYSSQARIKNTNGEFLDPRLWTYSIWGSTLLDSPELAPSGTKTGYIQFSNNNTDNSDLTLLIDCQQPCTEVHGLI